jgi:hypothetical protein
MSKQNGPSGSKTHRPMRGSANQGKKLCEKRRKNFGGGNCQVQFKTLLFFRPVCFGTVGCGVLPHPARLDDLPSAGTSLLDYERGVPVARPHGGRESWKRKDLHITATTPLCQRHCNHIKSRRPRHGAHVHGYVHGNHIRASATDTLASANDTRPKIILFFFSNLLSVLRNCQVQGCPTWRGHVPLGL